MGGKQMETLMLEMEFLFQKQVTDLPSGNHRWGKGDGSTRQDTALPHPSGISAGVWTRECRPFLLFWPDVRTWA